MTTRHTPTMRAANRRAFLRQSWLLFAFAAWLPQQARAQLCPDPVPSPIGPISCGSSSSYTDALLSNTTGFGNGLYIGPPDDSYHGLGGRAVTYDMQEVAIVDGPGTDFNVYEVDFGSIEFAAMLVSVSVNGVTFVSVKASESPMVPIPGDAAHGSDSYGRSYDIAIAGFAAVRYVRVTGVGSGAPPGINDGFELDAMGAIHYDEDIDDDGLTWCQEALYGTSAFNADSDGDGIPDRDELNCGLDPLDPDSDDDGVLDGADLCAGFDDAIDLDADGVPDDCDVCHGNNTVGDGDGDGICDDDDVCLGDDESGDSDADGVCNDVDSCPLDPANDVDADGVCGDVDDCQGDDTSGDSDGDQICDDSDLCTGNDASGDQDADEVCDSTDNCVTVANPDQLDTDSDHVGDACETDQDADGRDDDQDNCPTLFNPDQEDLDGDGAGDACDADDDGDGVADDLDNCPLAANADQADADSDGFGDACEGDDDADGVDDNADLCPGTPTSVPLDEHGCSGLQLLELHCGIPPAAPTSANTFLELENSARGRYVACVVQRSAVSERRGLLTVLQRAIAIRNAKEPLLGIYQSLLSRKR